MPKAGFEPARPFGHSVLNAACLPFHHLGLTLIFSPVGSKLLGRVTQPELRNQRERL